MKNQYEIPEIEIIVLSSDDIITTSCSSEWCDTEGPEVPA